MTKVYNGVRNCSNYIAVKSVEQPRKLEFSTMCYVNTVLVT